MQYAACWARGPTGRLAIILVAVVAAGLLAGCEGSSPIAPEPTLTQPVPKETPAPAPVAVAESSSVVADPEPAVPAAKVRKGGQIGRFRFTMYYVAVEPDAPRRDDAPTLAATVLSGEPDSL